MTGLAPARFSEVLLVPTLVSFLCPFRKDEQAPVPLLSPFFPPEGREILDGKRFPFFSLDHSQTPQLSRPLVKKLEIIFLPLPFLAICAP